MREKKRFVESTARAMREMSREKKPYRITLLKNLFVVHPTVFSPRYFNDTEFFSKALPPLNGRTFLEIGCGTGVISIFAARKGASSVVATDINPNAVANAKENVKKHKLQRIIRVLEGGLFGPIGARRFDVIFWNIPFGHVRKKKLSIVEKALFDPEYRQFSRFCKQAKHHLAGGGRLWIGFSPTIGHNGLFRKILRENQYAVKKIGETIQPQWIGQPKNLVKLELLEAVPLKKE